MEWIKERVWQLGLAIVLALLASAVIYIAGVNEGSPTLLWVGLILFFVALLIPLLIKFFEAVQENEGEEGEC
jgi:FtsH-binding integral membrane protein